MPPPIYPPDLLDVIEGFTAGPFDGEVYRHMFNDYSPSRVNVYGARWNPPEVAALYTSLQRETCLAEAEHAIAIQPLRPRAKRMLYRGARAVVGGCVPLDGRGSSCGGARSRRAPGR